MNNPVVQGMLQGSFKGVGFLFHEHRQVGGRKSVKYEFPNADQRVIQDLGLRQNIYQMSLILYTTPTEYYENRSQILTALNDPGAGLLVHPLDGNINAFCTTYFIHESIDDLNVIKLQATFEQTGDPIFPVVSQSFASQILNNFDTFIESINEDVSKFWALTNTVLNNAQYSVNLLQNMISVFEDMPNQIETKKNQLSNFVNSIDSFNDNLYPNAFNVDTMTVNVNDLFTQAFELTDNTVDKSTIFETFFGFISGNPVTQTTLPTQEREKNRVSLNQFLNCQALINDYVAITNTSFETEEDIETKSNLISEQFKYIVENNTYTDLLGNRGSVLSTTTLSLAEDMRFQTHEYLKDQLTNAKRLIEVDAQNQSLIQLVYSYYGDLTYLQLIYDLNTIVNPACVNGVIKIIEDTNAS